MDNCKAIREQIALGELTDDPELQGHLEGCATCAAYGRRNQAFDKVLHAELSWRAPTELTSRLLAIAADPLMFLPASIIHPRPKAWYVKLVTFLTIAAVTISLLVIWQFATLAVARMGGFDALLQVADMPAQWLSQLTQSLPQSRPIVDGLRYARDLAVWLLLATVLWAMLDKWRSRTEYTATN